MRIDKLFKVLVVGGSVLTAGCGDGAGNPSTGAPVVTVEADVPVAADARVAADAPAAAADAPEGRDAAARADGVSSWMSWFVDLPEEDAGPEDTGAVADAGPADSGPADGATADAGADAAADEGVLAWLSWA